jgi:hypothetical protein
MDELTLARFNVKVDRTGGPDACHLWTGAKDHSGYGLIAIRKRQIRAHRLAWTIENGMIPTGLVVRHDCDNPPCVNVRHLRLGTIAQNNQDAKDRNRHRAGARDGCAKITAQDAIAARQMRLDGLTYRTIAERLGVSYTAAHYIVNGKTWSDLPIPSDMPRQAKREHIADELVEVARRMRDEEGATWRQIERVTGYTRIHLMLRLPRRTGYNQEAHLTPTEADEAVRLRADGLSWTKLARHFGNRVSRMGLYYAWRDGYRWWREAEDRVSGS